jgi:MHS family proline/betaine transporter-like MFS transporter
MEWYDFGVYGFFAEAIGHQFFPAHDPSVSLLASFGVFAVGFIARPMGGLMFGHIGDQMGRRAAVIASVAMMVVPTFLMGLLPTYEQIGVAAPVILILLRLVQGLAVGGEYTTSMVLLVEEAQPRRRGRVGSFAPFGAFGGLLLGSAVGATITSLLSAEASASWGWRAAFLSGLAIGLVVLYVRRRLPPEEAVVANEEARQSPLVEAFRTQWTTILKVVGLNLANGIGFYLCFVYTTTWLKQFGHIPQATALALNSLALALLMIATPVAGIISDKIGRKPMLLLGTAGLTLFAWPLFRLMSEATIPAIIGAQAGFAAIMACFTGASPAFMVEVFPKHVRCSGLSVGYNLALSIFGGTVPMVAVFLIAETGDPLLPALYLSLAAAISFAMAAIIRTTAERTAEEWGAAEARPANFTPKHAGRNRMAAGALHWQPPPATRNPPDAQRSSHRPASVGRAPSCRSRFARWRHLARESRRVALLSSRRRRVHRHRYSGLDQKRARALVLRHHAGAQPDLGALGNRLRLVAARGARRYFRPSRRPSRAALDRAGARPALRSPDAEKRLGCALRRHRAVGRSRDRGDADAHPRSRGETSRTEQRGGCRRRRSGGRVARLWPDLCGRPLFAARPDHTGERRQAQGRLDVPHGRHPQQGRSGRGDL